MKAKQGKVVRPEKGTLPEWWKPELYDFLNDMPLDGWAWEFMRRAQLRELGVTPVDAMNPTPDWRKIPGSLQFYKPYPKARGHGGMAYDIPRAVGLKDEMERFYSRHLVSATRHEFGRGAPGTVGLKDERWRGLYRARVAVDQDGVTRVVIIPRVIVEIHVDLHRNMATIMKEFEGRVRGLRQNLKGTEKPGINVKTKPKLWAENKVLQSWDLKELGLSYLAIAKVLELAGKGAGESAYKDAAGNVYKDAARRACNSARHYIDCGHWFEVALFAGSSPTAYVRRPKVEKSEDDFWVEFDEYQSKDPTAQQ